MSKGNLWNNNWHGKVDVSGGKILRSMPLWLKTHLESTRDQIWLRDETAEPKCLSHGRICAKNKLNSTATVKGSPHYCTVPVLYTLTRNLKPSLTFPSFSPKCLPSVFYEPSEHHHCIMSITGTFVIPVVVLAMHCTTVFLKQGPADSSKLCLTHRQVESLLLSRL
jgi:hypothetical protein